MVDNKTFWLAANVLTVLLHIIGIGCYLVQGVENPIAVLWLIVVAIHVLELPMAFVAVKDRDIAIGGVVVMTIVFGFTWWVPARRGVYLANQS